MDTFGYIYKTTNLINNKIYIGKRLGNFNEKYLGSGIALMNAIKKYNKINFKVELLKEANSLTNLNNLEKAYIQKYRNKYGKDFLYNIADGGDGGCLVKMFGKDNPMFNNHTTRIERETRKCLRCNTNFVVRITSKKQYCNNKCSKSGKLFIYNEKLNKSIRIFKTEQEDFLKKGWVLGRGEVFKKKCSLTKIGNSNPMYGKGYLKTGGKNWMSGRFKEKCPNYGKKQTEEAKQKNREAHLGKVAWNKGLTKKQMEEYINEKHNKQKQ